MSDRWPHRAGLVQTFGTVDDAASRQVYIEPPFPMVAAWDLGVSIHRIRCHRLVATSLHRALDEIGAAFPSAARRVLHLDRFGGTYNKRRMRGGSRWSTHAWGIAIDLAPALNGLHTPWPTRAAMPLPVIQAFAAEGWTPAATAVGRDAMHFQALAEW